MRLRFVLCGMILGIVTLATFSGAPAMADPPQGTNPQATVVTFTCTRGGQTQSFQVASIGPNQAAAGQLLDGTGVVVLTHIEDDQGNVFYDVPGQADRTDLWTCTTPDFPGGIFTLFFTPRA
jgi:hypothetical protein